MQLAFTNVQRLRDAGVVIVDARRRHLQPVEVGRIHHHMRPGDHVKRPAGVVRRNRHVIGLRQRSDLPHLRDTAGPADVRHDVVHQPLLQHRQKVEARIHPLTHAERDVRMLPDLAQRVDALRLARLLEPGEVNRVHPVAHINRRRHVEIAVRIDHQLDVGANLLAYGGHHIHAQVCALGRDATRHITAMQGPHRGRIRVGFQRLEPFVHKLACLPRCGDGVIGVANVRVERHGVPDRAAKQIVNRLPQRLALDVPQS